MSGAFALTPVRRAAALSLLGGGVAALAACGSPPAQAPAGPTFSREAIESLLAHACIVGGATAAPSMAAGATLPPCSSNAAAPSPSGPTPTPHATPVP